MGSAPEHQFKAVEKTGQKNGREQSPGGNTGQVVYGGMTWADLDPTNGLLIPKVNSWSKGGC